MGRYTERIGVELHNNLPLVVIHALSSHGPVDVLTAGNGFSAQVPCAPFEDRVYLFVVPGSATEEGLLLQSEVHVSAKAADGSYAIRMEGRAHAGIPLSGHRDRSALEAWAPEGVPVHRLLVIPFAAETLEYVHGVGDELARYSGQTPVGISRGSLARDFVRAGLSGLALPMTIWTTVLYLGWLVAQGAVYPGRVFAAGLGLVAAFGVIAGVRLLVVSTAFGKWRKGMARLRDAPVLSEGLVAPGQAKRMAAFFLSGAALSLITLALIWGRQLVEVVLGLSGIWLVGPAWALHLMIRQPEAPR